MTVQLKDDHMSVQLQERIVSLCSLMTISGNERRATEQLQAQIGDLFDEMRVDALGNHLFIKRCGRPQAPRLLVDTHLDEIGMMVTGIKEGGFLTVTNIGGVDTRILPAGEVMIYGKETLYGVVATSPVHLLPAGETEKLKPITEMLIDTGYTAEELKELVPLGTPVGFKPVYTLLADGRLCGKAFDDKACGACVVDAIASVPAEALAGDVYFLFSTFEETGMCGPTVAGFDIRPDYALVIDVTHARIPDTEGRTLSPMGSGVSIAASAVTDRLLTLMVRHMCREQQIPYLVEAEPGNTGTNANVYGNVAQGIRTVLLSMPIKSMHSAAEVLYLEDARAMSRAVAAFIQSKEIAEVFGA